MTLTEAIAHIEGFYAKGTAPNRPQRNCNPGNINFAPWLQKKYGAIMETGTPSPRFAKFATVADGFSALHDLLSGPSYCNLSVEAAINRYAPPVENATQNYVDYVCHQCACKPTDLVKDVMANG